VSEATGFVVSDLKRMPNSGSLIGFLDVQLPSGMILHRCALFAKEGRSWVLPPAKSVMGRDGTVLKSATGKVQYEPTVSFIDRPTQDRWSAAVVAAVLAAHPETVT
jgi:hypothetical protein